MTHPPTRTAPLVLLVDDFDDAREMYRYQLTLQGYEVEEARDGHQALALAASRLPDIVVLDLSLPGLDGWTVARQLKDTAATAHIPVVALTAFARREEEARARDAGCDAFLTKPCLPQALADAIGRLLTSPEPPPPA